ncbi:MAG: zinc ribbon domain-containing protein [Terriglobales bacterium]
MPLYEYQCKKCKHRFEQIQKFSDKPVTKCPKCGGPVEKLISTSSVQFKGSGWYVSDYGRRGSAGQSTSSSPSESDSGSKESKDSKDSKDTKETKDSKKDDKPKSDTAAKKHKKD